VKPGPNRLVKATKWGRALLFVSHDFPPSTEVGSYSCAQIARYLPDYGWDPIVLTVQEKHYEPRYLDRTLTPPAPVIRTGRLPHPFELYRHAKKSVIRHAVAPPQTTPDRFAGFRQTRLESLRSLLAMPDDRIGWIVPAVVAGQRACRKHGITHILASGPCWTNHLVGLILAKCTGLAWTAHFRDPWTEWDRREQGRGQLAHSVESRLQRWVVRSAASVICVTERHAQLLRRAHPDVSPDKFVVVPNGYDESEWLDVPSDVLPGVPSAHAKFVMVYAGSFDYQDRNPQPVLEALKTLIERGDVDRSRLQVDLIGWCDTAEGQSVQVAASNLGLSGCVQFHGPMSKSNAFKRVAAANLLLLLAQGWTLQVPAKTYEYLRAGRPILALAPPTGAVADLLARTGGAWLVDPTHNEAIALAVREAYRAWLNGEPARAPDRRLVSTYDRRRLVARMAEILSRDRTYGRARRAMPQPHAPELH